MSTDAIAADVAEPRALLVYLDHADLADLADGKANDAVELENAFAASNAQLLVSLGHFLDLGGSDAATKQRWLDAVTRLAPVRFAVESGHGIVTSRIELESALDEAAEPIRLFQSVLRTKHEADTVARSARLADVASVSPNRLRELAEALLEGTVELPAGIDDVIPNLAELRQAWATMGKENILDRLSPTLEQAIATGNMDEFVRRLRERDARRRPRRSDLADELHLKFAVHADVFTVDANVAHAMRAISGKEIQIERRSGGPCGNRLYVYSTGQLSLVARAIRCLATAKPGSTEETAKTADP